MFLSVSYYMSWPFQSSRGGLKAHGIQELCHARAAPEGLEVGCWGLSSTAGQILQGAMSL